MMAETRADQTQQHQTHEREITEPVDLCDPGGHHLNIDAVGWSRRPLHDCNMRGVWGRTKRWDYWAVLAPELAVAITYADVDYLGMASIWWVDLTTGETGGRDVTVALSRGIALPDRPATAALSHRGRHSDVRITDDHRGTHLVAHWDEADGRRGNLDVVVGLPEGHESLNVVIPWSRRRFQFTSKHQARPASGTLRVGTEVRGIGAGEDGEAWGVLDVGRGRWPYRTRWNWGGGAGAASDGAVVGLQFGAKWTEGTGFTENGVIVDGRLTKIGAELDWDYDWDDPMRPWRVRHPDGTLDVTLEPAYDKHTRVEAVFMGTEVHQVFGRWSGHVTTDDGTRHELADILGFAEESRSRW